MHQKTLQDIAARWEGPECDFGNLTLGQAQADIQALLETVREQNKTQTAHREHSEKLMAIKDASESRRKRREAELRALVAELARLINQYADASAVGSEEANDD